jgi:hypothetical protein
LTYVLHLKAQQNHITPAEHKLCDLLLNTCTENMIGDFVSENDKFWWQDWWPSLDRKSRTALVLLLCGS